MQAITDPREILYVACAGTEPVEELGDENLHVSSVTLDSQIHERAPETIDCILVEATGYESRIARPVELLRETYPSTPLVAFVDDSDSVDELLAAGATDVIRSPVAETPQSLLQQRIENVCRGRFDQTVHERYETILNTAADAIYQFDPQGQIVAVNDAAADLVGCDRTELLGRSISEFLTPESLETSTQYIGNSLDEVVETKPFSMDVQTADGETVPCEVRISAWTDSDGELGGTVGVVRDVSEKRKQEAELRERENLLQQIGNYIRDLVWIADPNDPEGRIQFVSVAFEDIWHRPREFLDGAAAEPFFKTVHPDDRERIRDVNERLEREAVDYEEIYRIMRPDGEIRWVHERAFCIQENGTVDLTLGVTRDITERKRRERELERKHDLFTKAQDVADIGAWEYNLDGKNRWTENLYTIFDIPRDIEPTLETASELYHPDDWERVSAALERAMETVESFDLEARVQTESDDWRWVRVRGEPQTEDGEVVRVRGTAQDITDQREYEQQLERNRDLLKQTQRVGNVGGWEFDYRTKQLRWTDEVYEIHGLPLEYEPNVKEAIEFYHPEDRKAVQSALEESLATGEPYDVEARLVTADGEGRWVRTHGEPVFDGDEIVKLRGVTRDIHERKRRERRLETQRDELARLDGINRIIRDVDTALVGATSREEIEQAVCDRISQSGRYRHVLLFRDGTDGPVLWANCEASETQLADGASIQIQPDSPTRRALATGETQAVYDFEDCSETVCHLLGTDEPGSMAAIPIVYGEQQYGVVVVCTNSENTCDERELDVLDELGGTVGYAIAAVESREREAKLASLYESTQKLVGVESPQAVSEVVVETAAEILDPPGIGVFLFDNKNNVLQPAAVTDELREFYGDSIVFGPGYEDSLTWQSYVSGESQYYTNVSKAENLANPETDAQSALLVPLGEHGVFVVATDEHAPLDEPKRRLFGLLGATTEAALDRVAGHEGIRERDQRLAERTARLEQFEELFSLLSNIEQVLRRARTCKEIEQGVTQQIAETEPYAFAWIGTTSGNQSAIEPRVWTSANSGAEESYLDTVSLAFEGAEPAVRAAETGESVVISNVTDHLHTTDWAREALERSYQSVAAVPLQYGETTYGVLGVYATELDAFDTIVLRAFETLGEAVARAINSVETERAVLADQTVELELELPEPDAFLNAVARVTGETVSYREVMPAAGGRAHVLFALSDSTAADVETIEESFVAVDTLERVERGAETLFRATLTGSTVATTLLTCGAIPHNVVATDTKTTATVRLPHSQDVRVFLDRLREYYPGTELLARRESRIDDTRQKPEHAFDDLTDRQREVLILAYRSGFFESPRETTGVELAELLDISQPTVTHHLREAQRRLLNALFDEDTLDI